LKSTLTFKLGSVVTQAAQTKRNCKKY